MNKVIECNKSNCVFSHICKKSIGYIKENTFFCDEYRNLEMFLNELVERNMKENK